MIKSKILLKLDNLDLETQVDTLLSLSIWDKLTVKEREMWLEDGEIRDTENGRIFFSLLREIGCFKDLI